MSSEDRAERERQLAEFAKMLSAEPADFAGMSRSGTKPPTQKAQQLEEDDPFAVPLNADEDGDDDMDPLRAMMPAAFGSGRSKAPSRGMDLKHTPRAAPSAVAKAAPASSKVADDDDDEDEVGPRPPEGTAADANDRDDDDDDDDDMDDDDDDNGLPFSHEVKLHDHHKMVTCIAVDPAGARVITASNEYNIKFWDFNGMDYRLRPFRTISPVGSTVIRTLAWSLSGDSFLVAPAAPTLKLLDREGHVKSETTRGDMYIRDLNNTAGHVQAISCCQWHPTDKQTFMTAAADATIRLWDASNLKKQKAVIFSRSTQPGVKLAFDTARYSNDGKIIAGAHNNGSLRLWASSGPYHRPQHEVANAHMSGAETTSLLFSRDDRYLVSRSTDDSMKIWDIRSFNKPVSTTTDLPAGPNTGLTFSPDEKYIVTGVSPARKEDDGAVAVYTFPSLDPVKRLSMGKSSVTALQWHPKINQMLVGLESGAVQVLYSPTASVRGVMLCVTKHPKRFDAAEAFQVDRPIITPHALPAFQNKPKGVKRKLEKMRKDPVASKMPEPPVRGASRAGRVHNNHLTHFMMQSITKNTAMEEDPREALLKYAKVAEEQPVFTAAYRDTQPLPVFQEEETGEQEE